MGKQIREINLDRVIKVFGISNQIAVFLFVFRWICPFDGIIPFSTQLGHIGNVLLILCDGYFVIYSLSNKDFPYKKKVFSMIKANKIFLICMGLYFVYDFINLFYTENISYLYGKFFIVAQCMFLLLNYVYYASLTKTDYAISIGYRLGAALGVCICLSGIATGILYGFLHSLCNKDFHS